MNKCMWFSNQFSYICCNGDWEENTQEVRRVPFTIPEEQMPEASEEEI